MSGKPMMKDVKPVAQPFLTDVKTLRDRARQHMDAGAVTPGYGGELDTAIQVLNAALATELICVLRYKRHYFMAQGIHSAGVAAEFLEHSSDELAHAEQIADRIVQLGGEPDFSPEGLRTRAHSEYVEGTTLIDMIKEELVAERIAIDSYREMGCYLAAFDPTTRRMIEEIQAKEEEHADDLADLLRDLPKHGAK